MFIVNSSIRFEVYYFPTNRWQSGRIAELQKNVLYACAKYRERYIRASNEFVLNGTRNKVLPTNNEKCRGRMKQLLTLLLVSRVGY